MTNKNTRRFPITPCRDRTCDRPLRYLIAVILMVWPAYGPGHSALAQPVEATHLLIRRDLQVQPIALYEMDASQIVCASAGVRLVVPIRDTLALINLNPTTKADTQTPVLEHVDGRRWVGRLAGPRDPDVTSDPETEATVRWVNDYFGHLRFPLDSVLRVRLRYGATFPSLTGDPEDDVLTLANNDEMSGFVERIGPDFVELESDDGVMTRIPLQRVSTVTLLNPPQLPSGSRLWLADGSIVEIESMTVTPNTEAIRVDLAGSRPPVWFPFEFVRGVVFDSGALVALASLTPKSFRALGELGFRSEPPRIVSPIRPAGIADLRLRGPIEVVYDLPDGARRFSATVEIPRRARLWADFDLVLLVDGVEKWRQRMNDRHHRIDLAVDLAGQTMSIRLEEGERGPVQDVVVFVHPIIATR